MIYIIRFFQFSLKIGFALLTCQLSAEVINVAVASNFLQTAQQIGRQFEQQTGHKVSFSSGSSGKLYLQIANGAPFDLLLSADLDKPQQLVQNKFADAASLTLYARGKLLLWQKDGCDESTRKGYLLSSQVKQLAIANPKLAPFGAASKDYLVRLNAWNALKEKIIIAENIAQVAQYIKLGVVDAAIVAASLRENLGTSIKGCFISINNHANIDQALVILDRSEHLAVAQLFVDYLLSADSQTLIKNKGYWPIKPVKITE